MNTRIRSAVASAIGALLTGSLLTLTAVAQDDPDPQKKHAACEHLKGQQQADCEKRMKDMDKKGETDPSSVPNEDDKQPPEDPPT